MEINVFDTADKVAREAARLIAELIRENIAKKGFFTFAVSGGRTCLLYTSDAADE